MSGRDTRAMILDAVLDEVGDSGLARLSVEAVAERAGVSRQTVYRHFGNRDGMIEQAILREEHAFIDRMLAAAEGGESLQAAVQAAVTTALALARAHPVLTQLVENEPSSLLPYLLLGGGPVVSAAKPAVEDLISRYRPQLRPQRLRLIADLATRLLVSYIVSPDRTVSDRVLAGEMGRIVVRLVDD